MKLKIRRKEDEMPMIIDEWLDMLGDRFVTQRIGQLLGITFGRYVRDPRHYDKLMKALEAGDGLMMCGGDAVVVRLDGACRA